MKKIVMLVIALGLMGCARNVDYVKAHAKSRWAELGYSNPVYEGYNWSLFCGGDVWYSVKRPDSPGVLYSGYLCLWSGELVLYGPHVVSGDLQQLKK